MKRAATKRNPTIPKEGSRGLFRRLNLFSTLKWVTISEHPDDLFLDISGERDEGSWELGKDKVQRQA